MTSHPDIIELLPEVCSYCGDERAVEAVGRVMRAPEGYMESGVRSRDHSRARQLAIFVIMVIGRSGSSYVAHKYGFSHSNANHALYRVRLDMRIYKNMRRNLIAVMNEMMITEERRMMVWDFIHSDLTITEYFKRNKIEFEQLTDYQSFRKNRNNGFRHMFGSARNA